MDIFSGIVDQPATLGAVIVLSLTALATKELVIKSAKAHTNLLIFLNVTIFIVTGIFLFLLSRILINLGV